MVRSLTVVAAALFAAGLGMQAAMADWQLRIVDPGVRVFEVAAAPDGEVHVQSVAGDWRVLDMPEALAGRLSRGPGRPGLEPGIIPQGRVASGTTTFRRAWFARPTARYPHGAIGDTIEAVELAAVLSNGLPVRYQLGPGSVFEDLIPRIADLDGDGEEEIVAVRSYLDRGAALAVFGLRDGRLRPIAETPPIGQSNRWLNPAGIADFDGDGHTEIAVVVTPHIGGILQLWRLQDGGLVKVAEAKGYSNHAFGSPILLLTATADFDGDGVADLAVPSADRGSILLMSFAGGVRKIAAFDLPAPVEGGLALLDGGLIAALEDGRLAVIEAGD